MKQHRSGIIKSKYLPPVLLLLLLVAAWQAVSVSGVVPRYMLPSPVDVVRALCADFPLLMYHSCFSLAESMLGLVFAVILGFLLAWMMYSSPLLYSAFYPPVIITQTVPVVAIAPLLVLWFGYGILPKVVLIAVVSFFPIVIGLLSGYSSVDKDAVMLLKTMGASKTRVFFELCVPSALPQFFAGLRIAVTYSVVGAVISEWLGGFGGLGVYMTRVKNSYAFDKMFAVILLITVVSLLLLGAVRLLEKAVMPWRELDEKTPLQKKEIERHESN